MYSERFINRKKDLKLLSDFLGKDSQKSKILILSANSGIGKTSLVNKALKAYKATPAISVNIVDHPQFIADDGEYIQRFFRKLAEASDNDSRILSYKNFCEGQETRSIAKKVTKGVFNHLGNRYLGEEAMDVLKNTSEILVKKENKDKKDLLSYGLEALDNCSFVVRFENFQKVDRQSLEQIKKIFSACGGLTGIFEYTEGTDNAVSILNLQSALKDDNIDIILYKLPIISADEIVQGLSDRPEILRSVLRSHYESQNGNLRVIVDLQVWVDSGGKINGIPEETNGVDDFGTTKAVLRVLDDHKRFLLSMIINHGAEVDEDCLRNALAASSDRIQHLGLINIGEDLEELVNIKYLSKTDEILRIGHDSVTSAYIDDSKNKKFLIIANDIWINFYRNLLNQEDAFIPRAQILHWLAVLYATTDQPVQLMWVLEQCGHAALQSVTPKRLIKVFDQITKRLSMVDGQISERLNQLIERQGEVLYDANWLDEACECFERAHNLTLPARLMYADACLGTSRSDIGFDILDDLDRSKPAYGDTHRTVQLRTGLVRLHGLRSAGKLEDCELLFRQLIESECDMTEKERAFLLRSSDVGLYKDKDVPEIIRYLELSIALCEKHGLHADEAAARLALCQHFGYAGMFEEARQQLAAVEALTDHVWIERYSLLNNKAVLKLLDGSPKGEASQLLQKALLLATEDGDRLLLLCNLLGAGQVSAATQLARLLEDIPELGDELAKIAHFNLSIHYADQGNDDLAQIHRDKAVAMPNEPDSGFWNAALTNMAPCREGIRKRLALRYNLVFIVHWRMTSQTFKGIGQEMEK